MSYELVVFIILSCTCKIYNATPVFPILHILLCLWYKQQHIIHERKYEQKAFGRRKAF